jgi:hypothetical protein
LKSVISKCISPADRRAALAQRLAQAINETLPDRYEKAFCSASSPLNSQPSTLNFPKVQISPWPITGREGRLERFAEAEGKLKTIQATGSRNYHYLEGFYHRMRRDHSAAVAAFQSAEARQAVWERRGTGQPHAAAAPQLAAATINARRFILSFFRHFYRVVLFEAVSSDT